LDPQEITPYDPDKSDIFLKTLLGEHPDPRCPLLIRRRNGLKAGFRLPEAHLHEEPQSGCADRANIGEYSLNPIGKLVSKRNRAF